jgi:hypothetical protein
MLLFQLHVIYIGYIGSASILREFVRLLSTETNLRGGLEKLIVDFRKDGIADHFACKSVEELAGNQQTKAVSRNASSSEENDRLSS